LTLTVSGIRLRRRVFQPLARRHASCSTHNPIGTISPVSSATGTNRCGGTRPVPLGWRHRTSASTPLTRPSVSSTIGW
jgi:hypothetical protein